MRVIMGGLCPHALKFFDADLDRSDAKVVDEMGDVGLSHGPVLGSR